MADDKLDVSDDTDLLDDDLLAGDLNQPGGDGVLSPAANGGANGLAIGITSPSVTSDLEAMQARMSQLDEEEELLRKRQSEVERQMSMAAASPPSSRSFLSLEEKADIDARSVYIGNVDYGATAEELEQYFHGCGAINRVTIICDKWTSNPKGFAYIEFADKEAAQTAVALDNTLFRGRQIKVTPKRTNIPGISTTDRPPRGRGRSRGARGMAGAGVMYVPVPVGAAVGFGAAGGFGPVYPRGGRSRGRGPRRAWFSPY